MKTQKEIEDIKSEIQRKIEQIEVRITASKNEFEFSMFRDDKIRKIAQYNILLEVLK